MNARQPVPTEAFDPRVLRRALGNFATGVTIVTAHDGERIVGVTANSFSSVSLDPPLVLWSLDKRSGSYPVFQHATHFAINVLAIHQMELSNRFARPGENRFAGVGWRSGHGGCVVFDDTSASFQCEKYQTIDGGDHWIMIGRVVAFEDNGRAPLLYHQGAYSMALPHPHRERPPVAQGAAAGAGRLADHAYYLMTQAVRGYQQAYLHEQRRTGWRPGETRVLMLLDGGASDDPGRMARLADMPQEEVERTLDLLISRGLVQAQGGSYALTAAGAARVRDIWAVAEHHEQKIFAHFDAEQVRVFKTVLKGIIASTLGDSETG